MLHALSVLATSAASEAEPSKAAFYLCGGLLVAWAVVVTVIGMTSATFPATTAAKRGVMGLSALLVIGATATAVITA